MKACLESGKIRNEQDVAAAVHLDHPVTKRLAGLGLRGDVADHYESGRIVRLPGGEYVEVHQQLSDYERWKLVSFDDYAPIMLRPDKQGRITARSRLRARMSSWFFEDRIVPVSRTEIEASHAHGEHAAVEGGAHH